MAISDSAPESLRAAARRGYERARLRSALLWGSGAFLLALPAYRACGRSASAAVCLAALAVVVTAARFRGEAYEEGARAGVVAGILPCLLPAGLGLVDPDLCNVLFARGPWLCAAAGLAAGLILGLRSRTHTGAAFRVAAGVTVALAATLGCIPAGLMGFAGLAAGVLAGAFPVLAARRPLS